MPQAMDRDEGDFETRARDRVVVRSLAATDLATMVRIDGKLMGRDRAAYYEGKLREVMEESGVRVSLVAELNDRVVGFVMARVDFGEFGQTDPAAVIDTVGVDPGVKTQGVGQALLSQLLTNLSALHVATVHTQIRWNNFGLLRFLENCGFGPSQRVVVSRRLD